MTLLINELRIGNLVYYASCACILENALALKNVERYEPIPLTEEWFLKIPENLKYPDWIKSVHELQNWYYWNNNKKELEFVGKFKFERKEIK